MPRCSPMRLTGLVMATLPSIVCLSGCVDQPPPVAAVVKTCPAPVHYSATDKAEAKAELDSIPKHPLLDLMLSDYAVLARQSIDCAK